MPGEQNGQHYVDKMRDSGYSDEQIRQNLREAGWTNTQIDAAMAAGPSHPRDQQQQTHQANEGPGEAAGSQSASSTASLWLKRIAIGFAALFALFIGIGIIGVATESGDSENVGVERRESKGQPERPEPTKSSEAHKHTAKASSQPVPETRRGTQTESTSSAPETTSHPRSGAPPSQQSEAEQRADEPKSGAEQTEDGVQYVYSEERYSQAQAKINRAVASRLSDRGIRLTSVGEAPGVFIDWGSASWDPPRLMPTVDVYCDPEAGQTVGRTVSKIVADTCLEELPKHEQAAVTVYPWGQSDYRKEPLGEWTWDKQGQLVKHESLDF